MPSAEPDHEGRGRAARPAGGARLRPHTARGGGAGGGGGAPDRPRRATDADRAEPEVAIVLGGDGTMLRALQGFLGTGIPVVGVNFGRVGFLSSIAKEELEDGVRRVFAGELEVMELATLDVEAGGRDVRRRQRRGRLERHARPHGRDRVVDRGAGLRPRSLRRAHLLDAVGLDGLQPLQRRAGADVGARRDGAHLRRPARPSRAPVRRAARQRPRGLEPDPGRRLRRPRRRPPPCERRAGREGIDPARRAALASRHAAGRDFRAPLPAELRAGSSDVPARCRGYVCAAAGLPSRTMLRRLRIENLVLIREAELELAPG